MRDKTRNCSYAEYVSGSRGRAEVTVKGCREEKGKTGNGAETRALKEATEGISRDLMRGEEAALSDYRLLKLPLELPGTSMEALQGTTRFIRNPGKPEAGMGKDQKKNK